MAPGSTIWSYLRKLRLRLFKRREDARLRMIADFLTQVPLFATLSRSMLIELAETIHERRYRKDEFLYYQGDPGIGLYVIFSGCVRLVIEADEDMVEIQQSGERDVLGATCLLGGGALRRMETAQAMAETVVFGLFSPEYRTLQRRHPKTGAAVATLLARHFALTLDALRDRVQAESTPESTAAKLLDSDREATRRMIDLPSW